MRGRETKQSSMLCLMSPEGMVPERLLKGTLLMALYSVRSERQFCEQLSYNLLFRWFLDMDMVEPTFDATTFTKNRERLLAHDAAGEATKPTLRQRIPRRSLLARAAARRPSCRSRRTR